MLVKKLIKEIILKDLNVILIMKLIFIVNHKKFYGIFKNKIKVRYKIKLLLQILLMKKKMKVMFINRIFQKD